MVEKYIPLIALWQVLYLRLLIAQPGEQDSLAWWDSRVREG
jgi:hypothetical protein